MLAILLGNSRLIQRGGIVDRDIKFIAAGDIVLVVDDEANLLIQGAVSGSKRIQADHGLLAIVFRQVTPDIVVSGGQIGVGNLPDIVGGVLGGVQLHGVALLLDVLVDGGAGLLVKGAAVEVILGNNGGEVEGTVAPHRMMGLAGPLAFVMALVIHGAGHMDDGEVGDIDHGGREFFDRIFNRAVGIDAGGIAVGLNRTGGVLLGDDGNLHHQLLGRGMHLAGGGVLAHPVGSIVKAGDVDGLALDSHRVRRGVMVSGPGVGAAIIADGRAVHAVGLDVAVLVTLRQREGIRDHVAEDGGAAQRDSRAADGLADVREDVVQVGGATDGLVVIGRVRLVATAGHAGGRAISLLKFQI